MEDFILDSFEQAPFVVQERGVVKTTRFPPLRTQLARPTMAAGSGPSTSAARSSPWSPSGSSADAEERSASKSVRAGGRGDVDSCPLSTMQTLTCRMQEGEDGRPVRHCERTWKVLRHCMGRYVCPL